MTDAIAYRSPAGRVRVYDSGGRLTYAAEPGDEADRVWGELDQQIKNEKPAEWIDRLEQRAVKVAAPEQETLKMTENNEKKTKTKAVKKERQTAAKKIEARIENMIEEINKARKEILSGDENLEERAARVVDMLEKAVVIGTGGDLTAWYADKLGV